MATRPKHEGLIYVRRSTSRQETGIHEQLAWAIGEASRRGVHLDATAADLDHMLMHRLQAYHGIYLDDGISGSDLNRPGFVAFRRDALAQSRISHLFVHLSDRFSRPELAVQAMQVEIELLLAGLTIVFHNRISEPRERGLHYFEKDILLLYEYTQNGEFLSKLAIRVVQTQIHLARQGYRTGGTAPYGFIRVLVDGSGKEIQELPLGTTMRREGCHVVLKVNDPAKIQTWLYILHLYGERGWGLNRIAHHLNELGIPSPQAGVVRRIRGVRVPASGQWSMRTVAWLIDDATIIGLDEFGKRSKGKHRRWSPEGPRILTDAERHVDGRPKATYPASDSLIKARSRPTSEETSPLFEHCQQIREQRRRNRCGIARCPDPARYPLATRIHDLTDGCGAILYGCQKRQHRSYVCSRYMRSAARVCHRHSVDAEAALAFVLAVLRQRVESCGGRVALRARLEALAAAPDGSRSEAALNELEMAERHLAGLEAEAKSIRRNLSRAGDDESVFAAIKAEFKANEAEIARTQKRIEQLRDQQARRATTPGMEIEAAMQLFEEMERISGDPTARSEIPQLLGKLNLHLWLNFAEVSGVKRSIRKVRNGVVTLGVEPKALKRSTPATSSSPEPGIAVERSSGSLSNLSNHASFAPYDRNWFTIGTHGERGVSTP